MILSRLMDAQPSGFVHFPKISHGPVPRTLRRPIGFQKDPIVMRLAVLVSTGFPDKHTKMYRITSILFKRVGLHYNSFLMKMENISGGGREIPQSKNYQNIFECRTWARSPLRFAPCIPPNEHFPMNSLLDMEICLGIVARAAHGTPPCDYGGDSRLDP